MMWSIRIVPILKTFQIKKKFCPKKLKLTLETFSFGKIVFESGTTKQSY